MSDNTTPTAPGAQPEPKRSKGKLAIALALCGALAGGGYVLGGRGASAAPEGEATAGTVVEEEPVALDFTEIVDLPAMNINLADGHYLRVAVSLGLHSDGEEASGGGHGAAEDEGPSIPTAPAKDIVVSTLSGRTMASLATAEGRDEAKSALTAEILEHYGETVASVFLTEFVMQ
ncbi:MAG: flagellar basal body-associated FliL family protein [Ilumatobacteraceae bacterium]